jgi:hypothetical protein
MTAQRRWALSLGLVTLGGALSFLLGLFSGAPDDAGVALYAVASFAMAAGIVVLAVRLILGESWGEDVETLLAPLGILLGALFMAAFTEAFVVGISVAFHQGWGDREVQQFGGSEENWRSWLSQLQRGAPVGGAMIGALLGFVGWGSRLASWSEPPTKFPPN